VHGPNGLWLTTAGDLFIPDINVHRVRKVVGSSGIITTVAGSSSTGSYSGDSGAATSAGLDQPRGVYMDTTGKLFIADSNNARIRVVDTNGSITTFAGSGTASPFNGEGIDKLSANFKPHDVKGDSLGNIYITDNANNIVRVIDTSGIISTLFGSGTLGFTSGVASRLSSINAPNGLWLDSLGTVYFTDSNSIHSGITVTSPTSQPSRQPTGQPTFSPSLPAISPNLFMKLVAGTTSVGFSGDGGAATSAKIRSLLPWVDTNGNIHVADEVNYRVRKIDPTGIISTFGGTETTSTVGATAAIQSVNFYEPYSIVGDSAGTFLFISDRLYVWKYTFSTNIVTVYAHSPNQAAGFAGDTGQASSALLSGPTGLWLTTSNNLYIADTNNPTYRVLKTSIFD
jgi:hypothetical protein